MKLSKLKAMPALPTGQAGVRRGFTLIEVIISIAVILTAIVGLIGLSSFSVSSLETAKSKVIAVNLAQEGIEIIRNMRDSNWLIYRTQMEQGPEYSYLWLTGLGPGTYRVQYDSASLTANPDNPPLYKNSYGFYQYSPTGGTLTPFRRTITLQNIGDEIRVTSQVTWSEKGKSNTITVEDHLYNWFKSPNP